VRTCCQIVGEGELLDVAGVALSLFGGQEMVAPVADGESVAVRRRDATGD
jgi:hypothetical protein